MKAYFIGLVIMGGCLSYGCHTQQEKGENGSKYTADPQSIVRQDTLPPPVDTHAASSVSTKGWTAKQIRDSIELFFGKEYDSLPPHLRKIRRNMTSLWNTDDSVFLQLIIAEKEYVEAFKTYVFNSPLIQIGGGPYDRSPEEAISMDTTRFASRLHEPRPMAEFKGEREAMTRFFEQNLRYPESYKGTGTKVRLFYSFTIDSLGMLQNPVSLPENILYPLDTGKTYDEFREEALRVLRLMPAWEPAVNRIHGPVSVDTGLFFYFNEEGKCGIE